MYESESEDWYANEVKNFSPVVAKLRGFKSYH